MFQYFRRLSMFFKGKGYLTKCTVHISHCTFQVYFELEVFRTVVLLTRKKTGQFHL